MIDRLHRHMPETLMVAPYNPIPLPPRWNDPVLPPLSGNQRPAPSPSMVGPELEVLSCGLHSILLGLGRRGVVDMMVEVVEEGYVIKWVSKPLEDTLTVA